MIIRFETANGNEVPAADGEHFYWNRVAERVLRSYGNASEDEQIHDLGRRIRDAVEVCGKEDMERMEKALATPLPPVRGGYLG